MASVTVVKGDTLYGISSKYYKEYGYSSITTYMNDLVKWNNIKNPNYIYVGQVIQLNGSGGSTTTKPTTTNRVTGLQIGQLSNSENTVLVQWDWYKHDTTDHYKLLWYYSWGDGVYLSAENTTKDLCATYSPPSVPGVSIDRMKVSVTVTPIAQTTKDSKGNEKAKWTAQESTRVLYEFKKNSPSGTAATPDVEIEDYTLTAKVTSVPNNVTQVEFVVVKNNSNSTYKTKTVPVTTNYAACSFDIEAGTSYKVKCRYHNDSGTSDWSAWSGESGTKPNAPAGITTYRAETETSVYLAWEAVENATSYDVEYATQLDYLAGSNETTIESDIRTTSYILSGLESGQEYFFRLRAVNGQGESGWTPIVSVIVGTEPAAPTTWSSTTTVITGEGLTLYWVHNSEDGSAQFKANVELTIDGVTTYHELDTAAEDEDEKTMHYAVDTKGFLEGATILWRVQTAGATKTYGEWSVQRTVKVYAPPTMSINLTNVDGDEITTLNSFPLYIKGSAGPKTQAPVGYHVSIVSNTAYETNDFIGNIKTVRVGDEVYSEYIDSSSYELVVMLSAGDVDLVNNASYTVNCTLSMDSGLTGVDSRTFNVTWSGIEYEPNGETILDENDLTALIMPYCEDYDGNLIEDVTLSVYRRDFDGGFTEISSGLSNDRGRFIVDPHPALDYARYRIVARSETTGSISFYDMPGLPVGGKAVVIQWEEEWRPYENREYPYDNQPWSGTMLKLPYNIDISEQNDIDVSLVKYIGRKHPVGYYGTQVGQSQSWAVDIPKTDKECIYALRKLAVWMGNVYVREPSGSGYWANIKVSFSQNHLETVIPVRFDITRVAGGM